MIKAPLRRSTHLSAALWVVQPRDANRVPTTSQHCSSTPRQSTFRLNPPSCCSGPLATSLSDQWQLKVPVRKHPSRGSRQQAAGSRQRAAGSGQQVRDSAHVGYLTSAPMRTWKQCPRAPTLSRRWGRTRPYRGRTRRGRCTAAADRAWRARPCRRRLIQTRGRCSPV